MRWPVYVVDSSIFASIIVKDEFYDRALRFIKENFRLGLITIDIAMVEVTNTLWKHAYLLGGIPKSSYTTLRDSIKSLIINATTDIYRSEDGIEEAMDNALRFGITVYDSLYVTLALRRDCRLASFDEELRRKLEDAGLNIVMTP